MSDPINSIIITPAPIGSTVNANSPVNASLNTSQVAFAAVLGNATDNTSLATALSNKQKTITSGTAAPAGGVDGDIYLQYT